MRPNFALGTYNAIALDGLVPSHVSLSSARGNQLVSSIRKKKKNKKIKLRLPCKLKRSPHEGSNALLHELPVKEAALVELSEKKDGCRGTMMQTMRGSSALPTGTERAGKSGGQAG